MLFIFGRYVRNALLPPTSGPCPRCQNMAPMAWSRTYKTAHFFFFPLFSFSEQTSATCGACGFQALGRPPYPLPKLPFLDRMGFTIPFGVIGAGVIGFVVLIGAAIATAPPPPPPSAEQKERLRLEEHLGLGKTWGEGPGADALATAVAASLVKDEGFSKADIGVIVQVTEQPVRRVFIDCQYARLSDLRPKAREDLVNDIRNAIGARLTEGDHVVLAVKGSLLYGVLAQGLAEGDWDIEIDSVVSSDHVEKALRVGADTADASVKAAPSASASAAPSASAAASASASAAPSASSAPPPKGKKKKR